MKTTILFWDRQEGKTEAVIKMLKDGKETLILVCNSNMVKVIKERINKKIATEGFPKDLPFNIYSWNSQIKGLYPKRIIVDDIDSLSEKKLYQDIYPMGASNNSEMIFTFSEPETFKMFLGCKGGIVLEQRESEALKIFFDSPLESLFDKPVLHYAIDKIIKKLENVKIGMWQK